MALAVHVAETGHTINWDEAQVVYREEMLEKKEDQGELDN